MSVRRLLSELVPFNPARLADNAGAYSLWGTPGDNTFLIDGSNRVQLVADRSGNSAVNCLVLNGAAGNYASAPDSVPLSITGDIDLRVKVALADWTPTAQQSLIGKTGGSATRSYRLDVLVTTGYLNYQWSTDGTANTNVASTAAPPVADNGILWVRVTHDVDNGAGGNTVTFYTSSDGSSWTQLGAAVVGVGTTSIFDSSAGVEVGGTFSGTANVASGRFYRAQIYNGIAGTLVFDPDFSRAAKLATTLTESSSNAATVTINTSGDTGARICGERDLYQGTAAKQPIYSIAADGVPIATFDGSNDYVKSPPFALVQPESAYLTGSHVTWTDTDHILGGNAATAMEIIQSGVTPAVVISAGSSVASNTGLAVGTRAVVAAEFNGASSSLGINKGTATTGNAGAGNANGITVGAASDGSTPANITLSELLVRSVADPTSLQLRIAQYYMRRYGIPQ